MPRRRLRSQGEVVERCRALREELRAGLDRIDVADDDPLVAEAVWGGEALGALLWALELVELPPYDTPFEAEELLAADLEAARLREGEEIELECESARLWHWRARSTELQTTDALELPAGYATFDQLIAATAMRGYEQGLLPAPRRGDFDAYGKVYRHLTPEQHAEARSVAVERQHALNWLLGHGRGWDDVPLDT
jgi:hypothetical protein